MKGFSAGDSTISILALPPSLHALVTELRSPLTVVIWVNVRPAKVAVE